MLFAFNTAVLPALDLPALTARATALGYAAVEVHLPHAAAGDPAAGTILTERDLVKLAFEQAGLTLAGLSTHLHLDDDAAAPAIDATADAMRRAIDLAARLRCPHVRVLDAAVRPGRAPAEAAIRLADRLVPVADHAAGAGVTLLVQNALAFRTAGSLWRVIEQAGHPALGVAWDPLSAEAAGEPPAVSVPTLNSRIRHVLLRDATLDGGGQGVRQGSGGGPTAPARRVAALRRVGEGDLDLRTLVTRLRGVGFNGPVVVSYPPELPPAVGPVDELLAHALEQMRKWSPAPTTKPTPGSKKPPGGKHAA
jgi:sugar phosphate isomerase/epimerase